MNLENFCPRLRPGRVIPQGSRIVFETDNPYNQIILPMPLADLILLCSGQFSIRQIIEKIYRKQGAVPFKSILRAIHILHQGGFFENGHELTLNSHLQSWMEPRDNRWHLSWRFGQRIVADRRAPMAFYFLTLMLLVTSLFGMQGIPAHPLGLVLDLFQINPTGAQILTFLLCSSFLQSARNLFCGIQLLLLTGKAYNVDLRASLWGLYLHVGDEATDLFENRLYTAMFYLSQIVVGWAVLYALTPVLPETWWQTMLIANCMITFWELNPFVNSAGLSLTRALILPPEREIASWHFEASRVLKSINATSNQLDIDFARICAVWGSAWLLFSFAVLLQIAAAFGPALLNSLSHVNASSGFALTALVLWLGSLYAVSQAFVETILLSVARPWGRRIFGRLQEIWGRRQVEMTFDNILPKIQDLPLFSHFHEKQLLQLLEHSEITDLPAHTYILHPGDPCMELFVLLEGEVELTHHSGSRSWTTSLGPVSIFGETALLDQTAPAHLVTTIAPSRILEIPVAKIREVAHESQTVRQLDAFRNAILVNQFFASSPVFRSLSQSAIDFLSSRGALEYLDQGRLVFRQGDIGDSLYLVLRGSLDVEVHGTHVSQLNQGSFFGEIALIANIPRTATIHCREPSVLFKISSDAFWEILVQNLDLGVFIETISEDRLREDLELASHLKPTGSDPL